MKQYSEAVLNRYFESNYVGAFDESDPNVCTGQVGTPDNGEVVRVQMKIKNNIIDEICFKAQGSCATIAAIAYLCEVLDKKNVQVLDEITAQTIVEELLLPKVKIHSALLAIDACRNCLKD